MIITKNEFDYIKSKEERSLFSLKVDFGLRTVKVQRSKDAAIIEGNLVLDLQENLKENFCYLLDNQGVKKIAFFSSQTNRFYKLTPGGSWPTVSISSVPMHRLISPKKDTENKISLLKPYGVVLDTCMGLGYTAILASQKAKYVITFEKDENIVLLAKLNPVSEPLFRASNIKIKREDVSIAIKEFDDNYFDCIIHDPPTFKLAPDLYSPSFYKELFRALKPKGRLFHYTPLYKIKRGFDFPNRIKKKLKDSGFKIINFSQCAGGFLCRK